MYIKNGKFFKYGIHSLIVVDAIFERVDTEDDAVAALPARYGSGAAGASGAGAATGGAKAAAGAATGGAKAAAAATEGSTIPGAATKRDAGVPPDDAMRGAKDPFYVAKGAKDSSAFNLTEGTGECLVS
jgi:hypothetical protein